MRSQKYPNASPEASPGEAQSYIGKLLNFNHHQIFVEDVLGQGGFAFVFRVRSSNQQRFALKRMYVNNQRDLTICQREIHLLREFSAHRNIIKYVDHSINQLAKSFYGSHDDTIYEILLLTEYCSYGALITRLNEQRTLGINLNERQILRIFADLCNAVSACHFRRPEAVLHRDIKLENILIDAQQNHLLCDFGSAILLSAVSAAKPNDFQQYRPEQLTSNVIQELGEEIQRYTTLCYRAPELIDLYSRTPITLKVDIWAMGCLLYRLMYNQMPFGESVLAIQNGTFVIPDEFANEYSRELNLLVRYILETDVDKRPDIWQVSYLTYKLLGMDCPVPNRCQSKLPDCKTISMPLTDSEYRHQRTTALTKSKSSNLVEESLNHGTDINPRERPRGLLPSSASLNNFNSQSSSRLAPPLPPPPTSSSSSSSINASQSDSTQLMFDDDFSQIPTQAISLTNLPSGRISTNQHEQKPPQKRTSSPMTISAASGAALQQQLRPHPPPLQSNVHGHRRSSSQTIAPTAPRPSSEENQKSQVSLIDVSYEEQKVNPFLQAPFHHAPMNRPLLSSAFNPNGIVHGQRPSAFSAFQKPDLSVQRANGDVFTNAPFRTKAKAKQHNESLSNPLIDEYF